MPGIELDSATGKAKALPAVLLLWSPEKCLARRALRLRIQTAEEVGTLTRPLLVGAFGRECF